MNNEDTFPNDSKVFPAFSHRTYYEVSPETLNTKVETDNEQKVSERSPGYAVFVPVILEGGKKIM
jgi:hypothetical protein